MSKPQQDTSELDREIGRLNYRIKILESENDDLRQKLNESERRSRSVANALSDPLMGVNLDKWPIQYETKLAIRRFAEYRRHMGFSEYSITRWNAELSTWVREYSDEEIAMACYEAMKKGWRNVYPENHKHEPPSSNDDYCYML